MIEATSHARLRFIIPLYPSFQLDHLRRVPREGENGKAGSGGSADQRSYTLTDVQVREIINRDGHGDSRKAIRVVAADRARASRRARDAEEKLEKLEKSGRIAPEGAVIIQGDEAKHWPDMVKYLAESKLATIPKLLEAAKKVPDLETKVTQQEIRSRRAEAARAFDYNSKALDEVLETKGLALELRDVRVERDGRKVTEQLWAVRKADDEKGDWIPLDEYAEANLKIFLPALESADDDEESAGDEKNEQRSAGRSERRQSSSRESKEQGTRWPDQSRSSKPPTGAKNDDEIRKEAIASGIYTPF